MYDNVKSDLLICWHGRGCIFLIQAVWQGVGTAGPRTIQILSGRITMITKREFRCACWK